MRISKHFRFLILVVFLLPMQANAKDLWWAYLASYEKGPGSIVVNLGLRKQTPLAEYTKLVVTGTTYQTKSKDGFPDESDFERLNALSNKIVSAIQVVTPAVHVGSFTYDHEQLHYVYVKDTTKLEKILRDFYATACPGCKTYINIKQDPAWSAYQDFLYPNQMTIDFYRAELEKLGFYRQ